VIVAFSTSSPLSSVALLDASGSVVSAAEEMAPMAASGACMRMLDRLLTETGLTLSQATLFLVDLGPGSFTGVKVGVTIAKTLAYAEGKMCGGATSFDLISSEETVVLPSKRGEWFVRVPNAAPVRTTELPEGDFKGFGPGIENSCYPSAKRFADLLAGIVAVKPELLVPNYLIEPSISQPKTPYRAVEKKS